MKNFCLRLALFLLLGISLSLLSPQKALAKDSYGLTWTWTAQATPSAVAVDSLNNVYYAGYLASGSAVEMNPNYSLSHTNSDPKIATTGAIFLTKIGSDHSTYGFTDIIEADDPRIIDGIPTSISLTKIATDSADNIFILGSFNGNVNFDPTGGMDFHSSNGQTWQFLTEIKADGSYIHTYLWPSPYLILRDIAIDKNNNVYLGGMVTNNTGGNIDVNLDIIGGTYSRTVNAGDTMIFYTELTTGTPYSYDFSKTILDSSYFELDHLALDSAANVFLFGVFAGTVPFDGPDGTNFKTSNGLNDLYLTEYSSGRAYLSTQTIGGPNNESAGTLAIDRNNNIFYSGKLANAGDAVNFDPIGGSDPRTITVDGQDFLTELTNDGTTYGHSTLWNTSNLNIYKIAFDSNNLIYLIGTSSGAIDYNPTTGDIPAAAGGSNAFMTVLNSDGTYSYSYVWGGDGDEKATDAVFDSSDYLFIAGSTKSLSINFDPTGVTNIQTAFSGGENGYVTEFLPYVYTPPPSNNSSNQSNNSNSSSNSNSAPSCGGSKPSAPSIFQIWATKNTAVMHFIPSQGQQDSYTISYGPYNDAGTYNVTFSYSDKSGAIPYAINALNSGTIYYFKVRANNGCMPGSWSNTLSLRTAYSVGSTSKAFAYNSPDVSTGGSSSLGGSCSEYTVLSGDSLWSIAQKLLGAGTKYFQLWNTNKARFPSLNYSSIIRTGWALSVGC
jgi:hypothetical protein